MYGTGQKSFAGLRHRIMPPTKRRATPRQALVTESIYAIVYFGSIVLPYRIIVEAPTPTLASTLLARTVLPALGFFAAMAVLILLRPATLKDRPGIEMRGVLSGIFLPCFLCAGMFV
jgi:polyferredoxin